MLQSFFCDLSGADIIAKEAVSVADMAAAGAVANYANK